MKDGLRSRLLSKWYLYLVWAVFAFLVWDWLFGLMTKPDSGEKLSVFVGAYSCDTEKLRERLGKNGADYLRETDVSFFAADDYNFYMFLTVKTPDTDIFVLSESVIKEIGNSRFLSFEGIDAEKCFGEGIGLLGESGAYYGVKVYDGESQKGCAKEFIGYQKGESRESFYLLFNKNSMHTGGLSASGLDGATVAAALMLSL